MNENLTPEPTPSAAPVTEASATEPTPAPVSIETATFEHEVAMEAEAAPPIEPASTLDEAQASVAVMSAEEDPTDETAVEAPRALSPGALLQGDYEIKEVLARGLTNLYRADTGGYGPSQPWVLAERVLRPEPPVSAPATAPEPVADPQIEAIPSAQVLADAPSEPVAAPTSEESAPSESTAEIPLSELARSSGLGLTDAGEFAHAGESGGLGSEAGVFDAPVEVQTPLELSPAATSSSVDPSELYLDPEPLQPVKMRPADSVHLDLVHAPPVPDEEEEDELDDLPALLMPGEVWEQDGRQYCAWDWSETTSLQDFRDATNDERYFQVLARVAEAMAWQKSRGRVLELNRDTLRFDAQGHVRFYGFSSPRS
jgi:hypothetical protein